MFWVVFNQHTYLKCRFDIRTPTTSTRSIDFIIPLFRAISNVPIFTAISSWGWWPTERVSRRLSPLSPPAVFFYCAAAVYLSPATHRRWWWVHSEPISHLGLDIPAGCLLHTVKRSVGQPPQHPSPSPSPSSSSIRSSAGKNRAQRSSENKSNLSSQMYSYNCKTGLVPHWVESAAAGSSVINARMACAYLVRLKIALGASSVDGFSRV